MRRNRLAFTALLAAGVIASGCGSDDDSEPGSGDEPEAAQVQTTTSGAEPAPKARKGVRATMIDCVEGELGFDVAPDDADPDRLEVDDRAGKLQAVIVIHNDAAAARKAVEQTLGNGRNAVVFGRAELIRHAAGDTDTGVMANCVAAGYNRP